MPKYKEIYLVFPPAEEEGLAIQHGVLHFARPERLWIFARMYQRGPSMRVADVLSRDYDGLIGRVGWKGVAKEVASLPYPVVNVYGGEPMAGLPQVGVDDRAIGRMAAEYLMGLGFERFAFASVISDGYAIGRAAGFREALAEKDFKVEQCFEFNHPLRGLGQPCAHWLANLPRPVAIFAVNDLVAEWVSEFCRVLKILIPDEVAILGTGNEWLIAESTWPPLSSIALPYEQVGYEAGAMLERLMSRRKKTKPRPPKPILLPPEGVVVRQSTDTLAIADANLAAAVRYIRENACNKGLAIDQVADHAAVSRSVLFKLFRRHLSRTPHQEIRRVQIERAKRLLAQSHWSIDRIARECGFGRDSYLNKELKKHANLTPGQYRKQFRRI